MLLLQKLDEARQSRSAARMVLVEGENGDGVTVDEEGFDVSTADAPTPQRA